MRDAADQPIANARVVAWSQGTRTDPSVGATADANGKYTLYGLTDSSYKLFVSDLPGGDADPHERPASSAIEPQYWPTTSSLWQAVEVDIPYLGAAIGPIDFTTRAASSLQPIPFPDTRPTILGSPTLGEELTVDPGTQLGGVSGLDFSYQWQRDGHDLAGENGATYSPSAADLYHRLSVVVSATKAGYSWQHAKSAETYPVTDPSAIGHFADVLSTNPFFSDINWMATSGISMGTANLPGCPLFKPADALSRQAFAAFLYRYSAATFTPPEHPTFKDVGKDNPFYTAIEWMAAEGISTGTLQPCGAPLFKPSSEISRQATAVFLARLAHADLSTPGPQYFSDVPTNSVFAAAIGWMKASGVSTGTSQESGLPLYKPSDNVSRQAVAAFLSRYKSIP